MTECRNRQPSMTYRRFGKTEKELSVITLGGMRFVHGWDEPREVVPDDTLAEAVDSLKAALDVGINHFETAYGYRKSEAAYGQALGLLKVPRDRYFLMTKGHPATAAETRTMVEGQLKTLGVDHFDFYAWHGINNRENFQVACAPGGPVEELLRLKAEGVIGAVGFSTHASLDVIVEAIQTGLFDFINLHYYYFFQRNQAAIDLAELKDMGVFIISPNDKGGQLFNPPPLLRNLTAPVTPIQFNARWCLRHRAVHTLSFGMHRPEHFDELAGIVPLEWPPSAQDREIQGRMDARFSLDPTWPYTGYELSGDPSKIPVGEFIRMLRMHRCFDMTDFGRYRYNSYSPDDSWVYGNLATEEALALMDEGRFPQGIDVKGLLREAHRLFYRSK